MQNETTAFASQAELMLENGASLSDILLASTAMFGDYSSQVDDSSEIPSNGTIPA